MTEFTAQLAWLLLLLALNSLLAAARAAFVNASRTRLRQLQETGVSGAALAVRVAEDATRLIASLRLAQSLLRILIAGLAAYLLVPPLAGALGLWPALAPQAEGLAFLLVMLLATLVVVSAGEFLPEAMVMGAPEQAALAFAPLVAALEWLLGPLVRLTLWAAARISAPLAGQRLPLVTEEEIKTLVDAGEEGGAIEESEKDMIYSILEISSTVAREIMIPRIDVLALDVESPLPEAVAAVLSAGHSRIPLYQDSIDNVVGLLYAKDLLRAGQNAGQVTHLRQLMRPAYFVPETKKGDELLAELQQQRIHMAIVVDEYGGTAGIVTLEDIVEEIIGEIRDEYDVNEEALSERVSPDEVIFDARIAIDDVNEQCDLKLPSDDSDSLGGFIYGRLGHVPVPGETVVAGEAQFEVLSVAGRRIRKVRARRLPPPPETAPPAAGERGAAPPEDTDA